MDKTTIFFLPPSRYRDAEDGEAGRGRGEGRRRPRPWGWPGSGAKQRGGRGHLIPLLTLVGDGLWMEIDGGGRSATRNGTGDTGGGDGELGEEGELVVEVRDEVGSRSGPFISAERRFGRRFLSSRSFDGRQWRWGENIMALTLGWRGFGGLGAVGCDASCRFAVEKGRQRRRAVVEVTGRSNGGLRLSGKRGRAAVPAAGAGQSLACCPGGAGEGRGGAVCRGRAGGSRVGAGRGHPRVARKVYFTGN
jgi:hypothetical protein